jgi:hypothetical protein
VRRPSRRPAGPALRVALALVGLLAVASAHAWTPERFDAYCGGATFWVDRDPDVATAAWYAARTGDPDVPGDAACAALPQVAWFESSLAEALRRLAIEPFPASPAPGRLGPVRPDAAGRPGVRFYVGELESGYAAVVNCLRPAADQLGLLTVGAGTVDRLSRLSVPYVAIHELVHVVQGAQPLDRAACAGARLPLWVTEGQADAFATLWIRETFPAFAPAPFASLGRNLLGLRPFTASLTAPDGDALSANYSYRSSSLFRFVAERWHVGDHALWAETMGVAAPGGNDGLAWLDAVLRDPRFGVAQPLALVFPSFLASYAGWGRADSERWPHVGEAAWRNVAFGRCTEVVLTPQRSATTVAIAIEPIAGRCVQVRVEGVPAGEVASVEVLARAVRLEDVDDLHLGVVELGLTPLDGGPRTCVEVEPLAPLTLPACVAKPFTTLRQVGPDTVHARAFQAQAGLTTGAAWTDTLVLARVPGRPTDAAHAHRRVKTYGVTFALQLASARVDGGSVGPVQAAGNQVAPGHNGLPMVPGVGDYAPGDLLDPSRLLFGQQGPGGAAMSMMADDVGPGLFLLQLVEGADPDGDDVGRSFGVTFREASLAPGSLGSFPAAVSGTDPRRPGLGSAIVDASQGGAPRSRVEVRAWDDDHVRLTIRGPWCYADELREGRGCSVERTLEADVWLPFGDAWDLQAPYASIDSPVQALYREAFAAAVGFGPGFSAFPPVPPVPPPGPATPPAPSASGAAAGGFVCDCSCEGPAALEAAGLEISRLGPAGAAQAGVLVQCALSCAPTWAACEE